MYPTGMPIPGSAARLRQSLIKVRETLDPGHSDAALDRMVLVGHSMGGLLSKMMVQDSKLALWDATITVPRDQFKASPQIAGIARQRSHLSPIAVREPGRLHRHASSRQPDRR